jgi:hypothetical protein
MNIITIFQNILYSFKINFQKQKFVYLVDAFNNFDNLVKKKQSIAFFKMFFFVNEILQARVNMQWIELMPHIALN